MAGRVRIARVERRRQRANGAGVRRFGLRFGRATDAISALNVSVSASSSRLDPVSGSGVATLARRRHRRERRRQLADRFGQQPGQPEAADQRQAECESCRAPPGCVIASRIADRDERSTEFDA